MSSPRSRRTRVRLIAALLLPLIAFLLLRQAIGNATGALAVTEAMPTLWVLAFVVWRRRIDPIARLMILAASALSAVQILIARAAGQRPSPLDRDGASRLAPTWRRPAPDGCFAWCAPAARLLRHKRIRRRRGGRTIAIGPEMSARRRARALQQVRQTAAAQVRPLQAWTGSGNPPCPTPMRPGARRCRSGPGAAASTVDLRAGPTAPLGRLQAHGRLPFARQAGGVVSRPPFRCREALAVRRCDFWIWPEAAVSTRAPTATERMP